VGGMQVGETVRLQVAPTSGPAYQPWVVVDGGAGDADGQANGSVATSWQVPPHAARGTPVPATATRAASGTDSALFQARVASLLTDKGDYHPGEHAVLTGTGFDPGETVQLQVLHIDGRSNTGPEHQVWLVTDGSAQDLDGVRDGNIRTTW